MGERSYARFILRLVLDSRWERQGLPYGYLWWVGNDKEPGYAAMGDGGNIIYVNTKKKW